MTPVTIIKSAIADGLTITLTPTGTLKMTGDQSAVSRWLPIIRERKSELVALLAANENQPQEAIREAVEERAAIMEYDGSLLRDKAEAVAVLFEDFYRHLMGIGKTTGCCFAPAARYCAEGLRLKAAYHAACS